MTIAYYNGGVRVVDLSGLTGVALGDSTRSAAPCARSATTGRTTATGRNANSCRQAPSHRPGSPTQRHRARLDVNKNPGDRSRREFICPARRASSADNRGYSSRMLAERPWEELPALIAPAMRPGLNALADEMIETIRATVPAYSRPLEGPVAEGVRPGWRARWRSSSTSSKTATRARCPSASSTPSSGAARRARAAASRRCWRPTGSARAWRGGARRRGRASSSWTARCCRCSRSRSSPTSTSCRRRRRRATRASSPRRPARPIAAARRSRGC